MITFEDFKRVELKTGKVLSAERVDGSEKLLKLMVDIGEEVPRQILAGIGTVYSPDDLVGKNLCIVVNLAPRMMMGLESQGMIMAADGENGPVFLTPEKDVPAGSEIR